MKHVIEGRAGYSASLRPNPKVWALKYRSWLAALVAAIATMIAAPVQAETKSLYVSTTLTVDVNGSVIFFWRTTSL